MSRIDISRRFDDVVLPDGAINPQPRIPNTAVARALAADGFTDSAYQLFELTHDAQFQARTGKSDRIDWIMTSRALVAAVAAGQRLDSPPDASDHCGVTITVDLDAVAA